jgi:hypothetical protein
MLTSSIRALVFAFGLLVFMGGILAIASRTPVAASGFWALAIGGLVMVGAVWQKSRYRSEAAERDNLDPGPGGGEAGFLEPRFAPTNEQFVDPTTQRLMRVWVDPRTGERRYRAEG